MSKYLNLSIGAPARLRILRADAIAHNAKPYVRSNSTTWRNMRFDNLRNQWPGLCAGFNEKTPIWAIHGREYFRAEQFADAVDGVRIRHTGWFTDVDCSETARGIIARLPQGRILAGYVLSMNDERVYFPEIFDDPADAARAADGHAERLAESEREYSERFNAADALQSKIDTNLQRLRECVALRHRRCMEYVRDEISNLIESIRNDRETLATEYKGVL